MSERALPEGCDDVLTQEPTGPQHQDPAAPPLALIPMEPVSIWQDTQTWTIAGIALSVGFTIGILSAITLSSLLP